MVESQGNLLLEETTSLLLSSGAALQLLRYWKGELLIPVVAVTLLIQV